MGKAERPKKAKLIVGLIAPDESLFEKVRSVLERKFRNPVDLQSDIIDFTHTDYYNDEMGSPLKRRFLSFKKPVPLKNIERVKLITNRIESKFAINGKRSINIDPGYLDFSKLVVFSTKDYSHRVHVGGGIFAEVTLFFKDSKFNPWPWTYPDYKTEAYAAFFDKARELYKKNLN